MRKKHYQLLHKQPGGTGKGGSASYVESAPSSSINRVAYVLLRTLQVLCKLSRSKQQRSGLQGSVMRT